MTSLLTSQWLDACIIVPSEDCAIIAQLAQRAAAEGHAEEAAHDGVVAIPGAKTAAQVAENCGDAGELADLDALGAAGLAAAGLAPRPAAASRA